MKSQREKKELRAHYRERRNSLSPESRMRLNEAICSHLAALPCFSEAELVLFYYPIRNEPNLLSLAKLAKSLGKRIAFPISIEESCTLLFREVDSVEAMAEGTYGIPEPSEQNPIVTDFSHALCIVPALSFDPFGYRLGYGKGYYDRFLADFDGVSVGVVYSRCMDERLPRGAHDRAVRLIVTEEGGFRTK